MLDAYIYGGLRSPIGRHGGKLAALRPDDLVATVISATLAQSPFKPEDVEDIILGDANQAGEDARNIARHAGLLAGLPVEVPGQTINRLCASGLASVTEAARTVTCGEGRLIVAGGVESMSRAPFVLGKAENAYSRDLRVCDSTIGARFPNPKIIERYGNDTMPQTADNVARELGVGREDCDIFAAASQRKYAAAKADGFYDGEVTPVTVPRGRKSPPEVVAEDEHPRPQTDVSILAKLPTLFDGGVVTAGNAAGINDGAAALLIGNREIGEAQGAHPLGRFLAGAAAGVPPRIMGLGPVFATKKVLDRAGLELKDLDVIEINEAFAAQVLGCLKELGLPFDDSRVNPNGGAIAIGHPLGCSGTRLVLTALRQLERIGGRYALVTMCIGVGQGMAAVVECL